MRTSMPKVNPRLTVEVAAEHGYDDRQPPQCGGTTRTGRQCRNYVAYGQLFNGEGVFYGNEQDQRQIEQTRCAVHVQ